MEFLKKLNAFTGKPKDPRPELSSEEILNLLIASFKYSRGEPILQHMFFDYFTRHFNLSNKVKQTKLSENAIQTAVGILLSPRHQQATQDLYRNLPKDELKRIAVDELNNQLGELLMEDKTKEQLSKDELLKRICYYLIYRDYYYILFRPEIKKKSTVKSMVLDGKHVEGGMPFEKVWGELIPLLKSIINNEKEIEAPVKFKPGVEDSGIGESTSFMWKKIIANLT